MTASPPPLQLSSADALFIVPPFASIMQPALGVHILQAICRQAGFSVSILYGNLVLATMLGEDGYQEIVENARPSLVRERFFSHAAYGLPPAAGEEKASLNLPILHRMDEYADLWVDTMEAIIATGSFPVIGATSSFEQTSSSVAILNRVKQKDPGIITCMGGANCEDPMSRGIHSLNAAIDYVFSGESETTFLAFMRRLRNGERPEERTFSGTPCFDLDGHPTPLFDEFFDQYRQLFPKSPALVHNTLAVPYESSRGCWWGQKNHCTFCGLNGGGMTFREKSPDRVIADIKLYLNRYGVHEFNLTDNIMPHGYFKTLLPRLAQEIPENVNLFYEQKANINLEKAILLKKARVKRIQPGIEALNTNLLKLMKKGIMAHQNLALLRYARSLGIFVEWNLLTSFPGDQIRNYEETLALLTLIPHLQPPDGVFPIVFQRFSPYFTDPAAYGITGLHPKKGYQRVFPAHADFENLAYSFDGDFQSGAFESPVHHERIEALVAEWKDRWEDKPLAERPTLMIRKVSDSHYVVQDTRGLPGCEETMFLDREQTAPLIAGRAIKFKPRLAWALERNLLAELDNRLVPLATAPPEVLLEFEKESQPKALRQEKLAV